MKTMAWWASPLLAAFTAHGGHAQTTVTVQAFSGPRAALVSTATASKGAVPVDPATLKECDDWTTSGGKVRKQICGMRVTVTNITRTSGAATAPYQCDLRYEPAVRLKKRHRTILWHLDVAQTLNNWQVGYPDFRTIPAVALYDDFYFDDWERRGRSNFIWRVKRKHDQNQGSPYFLLIQFIDPADATRTPRFCEVVDPIIANDLTTEDDPEDE